MRLEKWERVESETRKVGERWRVRLEKWERVESETRKVGESGE